MTLRGFVLFLSKLTFTHLGIVNSALVCESVVSCLTFVLSLFFPFLSFVCCLFLDCGIPVYVYLYCSATEEINM